MSSTETSKSTLAAWRERLAALVPVRLRVPLSWTGAALMAGALGWMIHGGRLTSFSGFDRAGAEADIARTSEFLRSVREERDRRPEIDRRIAAVVSRSLGERTDAVDTALRARLNRIAEETGVRDLMVATGAAVERKSPARQEFVRLALPRSMRDQPDFVELRATISGEGAVDQVLRLVYRITVDPMLKRVEAIKFDPIKDGGRMRVTIRLSTAFVPGYEPVSLPGAPSAEALAGFSKYAVLAARNPFRVPSATGSGATTLVTAPATSLGSAAVVTEVSSATTTTEPEIPGGFPYGLWLLTGVVDGPAGTEAYFKNAGNGETRVLRVNESIAEFSFIGLDADAARIVAGGATYRVRVGESLEARALEAP